MCWSVAGSLVAHTLCLGYTANVCVHTESMLCVMQGMYCTDSLELHYDCSAFVVSLLLSLCYSAAYTDWDGVRRGSFQDRTGIRRQRV